MSGRNVLWGSLILVPGTAAADAAGAGPTIVFLASAAALVPLAWLIGEATEQAGLRTGPAIGGLLNATFGNVPELMVALFAVAGGLFEVVRGSLSGSVVGNLLLVLGMSLAVAGEGELDRRSAFSSLALAGVATAFFLVPAAAGWLGSGSVGELSLPVSALLLAVYGAAIWRSLEWRRRQQGEEREEPSWSLRRSLVALGVATAATAVVAELLVGSIEHFAETLHLGQFFVAAVIVAIVGNAAEHGGAVLIAAHGEAKLASDIAFESAAQVAAGLIPAVALVSWLFNPFPLDFRPVELAALAASVTLVALLVARGRSSRARGAVMVAAYVGVASAFFFAS